MSASLLRIESITKRFDGVRALVDFSCEVRQGQVIGLIGPNGAGKTTLFNVVTGFIMADTGRVLLRGSNITGLSPHRIANSGVARTFQDLRPIARMSVIDNLLLWQGEQRGENLRNVFLRPNACRDDEDRRTEAVVELLDVAGLAENRSSPASALSYGQQKLLTVLCCVSANADLLLLDEPVAGIAPQMADHVLRVIGDLPSQGKSAIMIEHDMEAAAKVCSRLFFMDAGRKIVDGTPDQVRRDPRVIEAFIR